MVTSAPSRSRARKCVSTRRRPITSPPGGGRLTRPKRASIGPAKRIDARMRAHRAGSSSRGSARAVFTSTVFGPSQRTSAPRCASKASIVSTSRMCGTLSMRQGPSASSVAARMGRTAFLLPAGRIVPFKARPPETEKEGGMGQPSYAAACAGVKRSRTFATWTPRRPALLTLGAVAAASGPGSVTLVARAVGIRQSGTRAFSLAAALETAGGALAFTLPLALHGPHPLAWLVFAVGSGALVGMVFLSLTRLRPARADVGFALLATLLFGPGVGYAAELAPFLACASATALIVNASPRRHAVRREIGRAHV